MAYLPGWAAVWNRLRHWTTLLISGSSYVDLSFLEYVRLMMTVAA
jgi:hypothetical protein